VPLGPKIERHQEAPLAKLVQVLQKLHTDIRGGIV